MHLTSSNSISGIWNVPEFLQPWVLEVFAGAETKSSDAEETENSGTEKIE